MIKFTPTTKRHATSPQREHERPLLALQARRPVDLLILVALALVSAAAASDPADLVQQGNVAFDLGQFATALQYYEQAEERITDPGLVAFNKAVALYRLGRHREAELHFRRCLDNTEEPRRARAYYDLGNCLMHQDDGNDAALLRSAVKCFQQCLAREAADADLIANARHNLELAKLLLLKARPSTVKKNEDDDSERAGGSNPRPNDQGDDNQPTATNPNAANPDPAKMGKTEPVTASQAEKAVESQNAPPGRGQLPPVQDQDQLVPLSPEDAAAHLQRAATRIMLERREHHQRSAQTPGRKVMDW